MAHINRNYDICYDKIGKCNECRLISNLTYDTVKAGWWCSNCTPDWTIKNWIRKGGALQGIKMKRYG